jgi:hypothetical protein
MTNTTTTLLKACSLSMALAGSVAFIAWVAVPDVAYADSGKGNGGGNGNGNGNSGGNGNGNGGGNGNSSDNDSAPTGEDADDTAPAKTEKAAKKPKKVSLADELGLSPSELGALNAAHASPNALKNASPKSRVGKIAAYRDSVVAGEEIAAELETRKAELEALEPPARTIAEIDADVDAAAADLADKQAAVTQLEADLAAAGGADPEIEADLEAARVAAEEAEATKAELEAEQAAAVEYETLTEEVAELEQQVEDQPEVERELLEAAANKPVTDEVEAAVKLLLGL